MSTQDTVLLLSKSQLWSSLQRKVSKTMLRIHTGIGKSLVPLPGEGRRRQTGTVTATFGQAFQARVPGQGPVLYLKT